MTEEVMIENRENENEQRAELPAGNGEFEAPNALENPIQPEGEAAMLNQRETRAKRAARESSVDPKDILQRVQDRIAALKEQLVTRETNKGGSRGSLNELKGIFSSEETQIASDLSLIHDMFANDNLAEGLRKELETRFQEEAKRVDELNEEIVDALRDTGYPKVQQLRDQWDELRIENRQLAKREADILARLELESVEKLDEKLQALQKSVDSQKELTELINVSCAKMGVTNLRLAVESMTALKQEKDLLTKL